MNDYRCETCNYYDDDDNKAACNIREEWISTDVWSWIEVVGCASHSDFQSERGDCIWAEDEDGIYHTSCGDAFEFMNGTPDDNHIKFCPYCGKELRQSKESE
jgi:hypothetical protein